MARKTELAALRLDLLQEGYNFVVEQPSHGPLELAVFSGDLGASWSVPHGNAMLLLLTFYIALRIRPPTTQDSTSIPTRFQRSVIQATSSTSVSIETPSNAPGSTSSPSATTALPGSAAKKQVFTFDQVHPPPTTQYVLFESTAKPLVSRFTEGFNCTILAYGQTSSGKTFTMTGIDLEADPSDPNNEMGIIPRAVSNIFSRAKQLKEERGGAWNYTIKGSFVEVYNEDLIDLLGSDDTTGVKREVQIREDKEGHIIWGGLREVNVRNAAEVMTYAFIRFSEVVCALTNPPNDPQPPPQRHVDTAYK